MLKSTLVIVAAAVLAGCGTVTADTSESSSSSSTAPHTSAASTRASTAVPYSTSPDPTPARPHTSASNAAALLATMTEQQRVGQLLMVDCPSTYIAGATVAAIQQQDVGSVILDGNSDLSVAGTKALATELENDNASPAKLFIATDQEGGLVQRLRGSGFTRVPSAVDQGQLAPSALRREAAQWGSELHQAGVNVDLGPVMDTVPAAGWGSNPPIGDLDREFGSTPAAVAEHGVAVINGLQSAHVDATAKHFPGLGRVRQNTDTNSGVTDTVTTEHDSFLAPYAAAVKAGTHFMMMSTAVYAKIDPDHPAAFSSTIIEGILRGDLGFTGVVISDDLGSAAQVQMMAPGRRAVDFIGAGGDIVLTVDPAVVTDMTAALLSKARADPAFKSRVDAAALTVLNAKQQLGLLD